MAYQINLTGKEIDERLQNIGTAKDVAAANGTLYARISKNADDIATKASAEELEGVKGKVNTLNSKVDKNAEAIGAAEDSASVNGSLYARVKKNADDIATKASNSDLAAVQSKVDTKASNADLEALASRVTGLEDGMPTAVQLVVKTI